jgi:hypothetical protein
VQIILGFAPFIAFALLTRFTGVDASLWVAAAIAAALAARNAFAGRSIKILEAGTVVLFGLLATYTTLTQTYWSLPLVRAVVDGGLLAIVLLSIAVRQPFTLQYAREQVPPEIQSSPVFLRVNIVISLVWRSPSPLGSSPTSRWNMRRARRCGSTWPSLSPRSSAPCVSLNGIRQRYEKPTSPPRKSETPGPSGERQRKRNSFDTILAAADRLDRFVHPAAPSENLVGHSDQQGIWRSGRRGGADRSRDLKLLALRIERASNDESGGCRTADAGKAMDEERLAAIPGIGEIKQLANVLGARRDMSLLGFDNVRQRQDQVTV